jgi:hypothetical protein
MIEAKVQADSSAAPAWFETAAANAGASRRMAGIHLLVGGFILLLLGVQTTIFVLLAGQHLGAGEYGLLHLGSCLVGWLVWQAGARGAGRENAGLVLEILILTALAGPFGTLISAGLLIRPRRASAASGHEDESRTPPGAKQAHPGSGWLYKPARLKSGRRVRPLIDVLSEGTQAEKFEALRVVARRYEPALAPALHCGMADGSAPVRVLAATVTAKLRMVYSDRVAALEAELADWPADARLLRQLARARLKLAESGLIDGSHARQEIARAREELARAAQTDGVGDRASPGQC